MWSMAASLDDGRGIGFLRPWLLEKYAWSWGYIGVLLERLNIEWMRD